jgi:alkylation response protein AidB-like acyl-CoA dehydrogenase
VDFSYVELDDETQSFLSEVESFIEEYVTDEVRAELRLSGASHSPTIHHALGERGWIMPHWSREDGGAELDELKRRILALEFERHRVPSITTDTTVIGANVITAFGSDALKTETLRGIGVGDICICLGYTEPDAGSDLAAARTFARKDGDEWVINGSKMFTTGAESCQYSLVLCRTNLDVSKHRGLTTFLVPLDSPGVEIHPIKTMGGERTNMVFYSDVQISDHYRLGPVDDGWQVIAAPLDDEHGIGQVDEFGISEINGQGAWHARTLKEVYENALDWSWTVRPDGTRPSDDPLVRLRLIRVALDIELCRATPGAMGRLVAADSLIRASANLLELSAPEGLIAEGGEGAVGNGVFEWAHRFAQGSAIYGGTTDIHRNIIAERELGLPRARVTT